MADCTILILTYKGKKHLEYLLPTVRQTIDNYTGDFKIGVLIVDNGCDKDTKEFTNLHYPDFQYEYSPVNDYLFSLNSFVQQLKTPFVLILNDDMRTHPEILNILIPLLKVDESLFSVSCKIRDWDDSFTASAVRTVKLSKGWLSHCFSDPNESRTRYSYYPGGGAAIFRTSMFNELNGFDDLFRPAYCEDTDLGHRAWQKGWKTIYCPDAILFHREGGTIKDQFKSDKLEQLIVKNNVKCMLKNVNLPFFRFWFYILLPYRLLVNYFGNRNVYIGLVQALREVISFNRIKSHKGISRDNSWMKILNTDFEPGKMI